MITPIHSQNLDQIRNPVFRRYALRYVEIYEDFLAQISKLGLGFEPGSDLIRQTEWLGQLQESGVEVRNGCKSLVYNHISPSCVACKTAENSVTFFISLRCHRDCYFCFNPNQEDYQHFQNHERDLSRELEGMAAQGRNLQHIALTGGEPMLYPAKTLQFFREARRLFPKAFTRLYTSGDQLNRENLAQLAEAGLDEIRISVRLHDTKQARRHSYDVLALSREYLPHVLVEMPILPNSYPEMVELLEELDRIGVEGINLLEFCYPLNNTADFMSRGFKIKTPPFRVLYNYWYAGGLSIAGSEEVCLDLVQYAVDRKLRLGVHYCSLENKHSGQIYTQNSKAPQTRIGFFSPNDFFIKTAKVFGEDIQPVKRVLLKTPRAVFVLHPEQGSLEFNPHLIPLLVSLKIQVAISYHVFEARPDGSYLRELKVDYTTPEEFEPEKDL